ncbi:MAG: gamma-glutamyl-gamma-aminobutyrate hydrolase family protein [Ignavibacteria bacterium]|nr:gamma-glutamyl-gamma-aminobutyrate hydrolase family protein [Ignavibacteria bacterium]
MVIGVTDTMGSEHKFQKYLTWLQGGGIHVNCVTLSYKIDNLSKVDTCDALVLTGGHDVEPSLYGGPAHHSKITDIDRLRDEFELKAIERALGVNIPVLGICRGLQLGNVFFGGTLLPDLEEAGYGSHRSSGNEECRHSVSIVNGSFLGDVSGIERGFVNSSHHQAVEMVGKDLRVVARSDDGIIEAMEFGGNTVQPFVLFVQWHPERMSDFENPLSKGILDRFLSSIQRMQGVHNR